MLNQRRDLNMIEEFACFFIFLHNNWFFTFMAHHEIIIMYFCLISVEIIYRWTHVVTAKGTLADVG